jgi:isopentenyldiphosphate isomerase
MALIQVVDEDDRPVGVASKEEAWQGLRHRAVWVMLLDGEGNVLLQHRDPSKKLLPDRWDASVGGHVDEGEDYPEAAKREMEEEIGVSDVPLTEIGSSYCEESFGGFSLKRFYKVYRGFIKGTPEKLETGGVDEVKWFTLENARKLAAEYPGDVAPGLREAMKFYKELK